MYLIFDTETTGLPQNWKAPLTDFDMFWVGHTDTTTNLGKALDNWFGDVVDNRTIELNVSSDHFKLYQERHETCTRQVLDCQNQYPGLTVYTENIIAGNEQPYKQKYNLNII